jgi:hypothetical protein
MQKTTLPQIGLHFVATKPFAATFAQKQWHPHQYGQTQPAY